MISKAHIALALKNLGLIEFEIHKYTNLRGIPTGQFILTLYDLQTVPCIQDILARIPQLCAVEIVFEKLDPDAIWVTPCQPAPWPSFERMAMGRQRK